VTRVLHVLPHAGGGAQTYLDLLARIEDVEQRSVELADSASAPLSVLRRWPGAVSQRADVLHLHGDMAGALMLPALWRRRAVWTTHGLHALRRAVPGIRLALRGVVAATRVTLCCSHAERDELAALVPVRLHERLRVVPNGVDVPPATTPEQRAAARAELGLAPDGRVALFLGELSERKDPLTAARAAQAAGVQLLVAGDGPLRPALAALGDGVRVLGHRTDVERLLRAADTFVLPSQREGISFAVLEAMAHGLAMVVSDGPGNPEAVGPAGLVVPVGDVAGFATALRADPAPLGAAARERVLREFPVQRLLDGVCAAYQA
jgi:glycosyltransferase involved in cell wall biosynthesis